MPKTINFTTVSAAIIGMIGLFGLATMSGAMLLVYGALLAMAVIVLCSELRHGARSPLVDTQTSVTFDDDTLIYKTDDVTHSVPVSEIKRIDIITNDRGPFEEDMFWHIATGAEVIVIPSAADRDNAVFDMLTALGNADYVAALEAGSCLANATFAVWPAPPDHAPV